MKKIISIILAAVLMISLIGCSSSSDQTASSRATSGFRVGFSKISIMPEEEIGLGGYGNTSTRISNGFLSYIYGSCVAITDETDNTVLLYSIDAIRSTPEITKQLREQLQSTTGIAADHVMLSATHSHSTPDIGAYAEPVTKRYEQYLIKQLVQCGADALEDQRNATAFINNVETSGLNFVRHYELSDGSFAGPNFGDWNAGTIVGHTTDADTMMHLIKFVRDDAQDIVIANWRCHPTITGGMKEFDICADFVGEFRDYVEEKTGALCVYYQGDAGNIAPSSNIEGETTTTDYRMFGQMLGSYAVGGLNEMTEVKTGLIETKQVIIPMEVNHDTDNQLADAKEIYALWTTDYNRDAANKFAQSKGIRSVYKASAILTRAELGQTLDLELDAITIADSLAFVTAPYEMFDTNGDAIKAASPYDMTMILGYCNGQWSYIPSAYGFEYTCYESDTCKFKPGSGEQLQDTFISMLNELHAS